MSIGRSLFNEMRPLFRMLEEPFGRGAFLHRGQDPFNNLITRPAIDISEHGDKFVVDADLPGFKKENLEIKLGDGGESLTIQGKIVDKGRSQIPSERGDADGAAGDATTQALTEQPERTQISAERAVNYSKNLTFSRTIWLPQAVDSKEVSAKLENGVLTVVLKKAKDDKQRTSIRID